MSNSENIAASLRSDFKSMRALATCAICDQLLYEPWTIACGHTYCYSCLCSWFSQDKRKKTCPECRSKVKAMPAPSFLLKQVVELIIKRSELMLADESSEQHQIRKEEEIELVDNDRSSTNGLFKGMFAAKQNKLWRDISDGVFRCSSCGFEHEGGPICTNCGEEVNEDEDEDEDIDSAERDTVDIDSIGFDLDVQYDQDELFNYRNYHHFQQHVASYVDTTYSRRTANNHNLNRLGTNRDGADIDLMNESDSEGTELSVVSDSSSEMDEEDDSSLQSFIIRDEEEEENDNESNSDRSLDSQHNLQPPNTRQRQTITISDDESDEGGAISNRRQRHRCNNTYSSSSETSSSNPSPFAVPKTHSNVFESGERSNNAELLRNAGWSPLDHGDEGDEERYNHTSRNSRQHTIDIDSQSDTNSDTPGGKETSDEEDNDKDNDNNENDNDDEDEDEDNNDDEDEDNNADDLQIGQCFDSGSSNSSNSNNHISPRFTGFSDSSYPHSTDEDGDIDMRTSYHNIRNLTSREDSSAAWGTYPAGRSVDGPADDLDSNVSFRNISQHSSPRLFNNRGTARKAIRNTDETRRKRPMWDSLAHTLGTDSGNSSAAARLGKTLATSRRRSNF